jgi:hypothetical protein
VHKVDGSQLAAPVTLLEGVLEPGRLIPPHTHTREDEVSFVVAGTVTFWIDGRSHLAPPGSYVIKPRGLPHAIWNATDEVARLVEIHSPGGQARYYDSLAELLVAPGWMMPNGQHGSLRCRPGGVSRPTRKWCRRSSPTTASSRSTRGEPRPPQPVVSAPLSVISVGPGRN